MQKALHVEVDGVQTHIFSGDFPDNMTQIVYLGDTLPAGPGYLDAQRFERLNDMWQTPSGPIYTFAQETGAAYSARLYGGNCGYTALHDLTPEAVPNAVVALLMPLEDFTRTREQIIYGSITNNPAVLPIEVRTPSFNESALRTDGNGGQVEWFDDALEHAKLGLEADLNLAHNLQTARNMIVLAAGNFDVGLVTEIHDAVRNAKVQGGSRTNQPYKNFDVPDKSEVTVGFQKGPFTRVTMRSLGRYELEDSTPPYFEEIARHTFACAQGIQAELSQFEPGAHFDVSTFSGRIDWGFSRNLTATLDVRPEATVPAVNFLNDVFDRLPQINTDQVTETTTAQFGRLQARFGATATGTVVTATSYLTFGSEHVISPAEILQGLEKPGVRDNLFDYVSQVSTDVSAANRRTSVILPDQTVAQSVLDQIGDITGAIPNVRQSLPGIASDHEYL